MSVTVALIPDVNLPITPDTTDARLQALASALTGLVDHAFGPAWGENWQSHYPVIARPRGAPALTPGPHLWPFYIQATSDVQGAGGYHSVDGTGNPFAKIFLDGGPLALVTSHELMEAIVDRFGIAAVIAQDRNNPQNGATYLMEVGNPVERHTVPFSWAGETWQMSDFTLPSYYVPGDRSGRYSWGGNAPAPLTPAPGCRQSVFLGGQSWQTLNSDGSSTTGTEAYDKHVSRVA